MQAQPLLFPPSSYMLTGCRQNFEVTQTFQSFETLRSGQLLPGHHKVMWLNLMIPASQGKVLDTHLLTSKFFHPAADQKYVFF